MSQTTSLRSAIRTILATRWDDLSEEQQQWAAERGYTTETAVTYHAEFREECGGDTTEDYDDEPDVGDIEADLTAWVSEGDYGSDGASVSAHWTLYRRTQTEYGETDVEIASGHATVEIDADHESLIATATRGCEHSCGDSPDDHEWTSTGEGGCDSNPGVWSTGGTSMSFASHCRTCGLHRSEHHTGSQRNPGEHDTVSYEMPESWCAACEREECRYTIEGEVVQFSACDDDEPAGEYLTDACDTEDEAREALLTEIHERGLRRGENRLFVACDDVDDTGYYGLVY